MMPKKKALKKTVKKKEKQTPKVIAGRINEMAQGIVRDIKKEIDPEFITQQRGRSNVEFDEAKGVLRLGDKNTTRTFLNIGHAKKFMQTMLVSSKAHEYLKHNKTASIREIYYELKHTVPNTKENTFEGQTESDSCIVDLEHSVDTIREKLNLHANPKGTLYGDITLRDKVHHNDKFNCGKLGRGGWSIMSRIEPEEIEIVDVKAKYILVIETAAMYERLVEERFAQKNKCILVGTGGQAARGTRRLIHRLHIEKKLPVLCFSVDGEETVVLEENGLIKNVQLKELMNGKEILKVDGIIENERASINAKSLCFDDKKTGFGQINQIIRHPIVEDLFEVKTDLGYSVKATKSHSLIVYDSKKHEFVEKTPLEVDLEKDFAVVSLDVPNNENLERIDLAEFAYNHPNAEIKEMQIINRKNKTSIPRFVEKGSLPDFCRLLGYYAAEGHLDKYRITFSFNKKERDYIEDVARISKDLFGIEAKEHSPHKTSAQINLHNALLSKIFKNIASTGSGNKRVPDIVFNVPTKAKKEFLKGYFRGDGRVDFKKEKSAVELWAKTVSKKLVYDLVLLVSQIGANATIQYPKESEEEHEVEMQLASGPYKTKIVARQKPYLVSIANKEALLELKDLVAELRPEALKHIENNYIKTPKVDSLPREFVEKFRESFRKEFRGELEKKLPPATFQWPRISKKKLRSLLNNRNLSENLQFLKEFANNKTTLARIKSVGKVEAKDKFVYDIEMANTHRFFSNFICVHNTDGDPFGWYIYSVIKQGSMALAAHSDFMACPDARYIGMTLDDVETYDLQNVTEKMKDGDIKRAKEMLEYPWFQNKEWQAQLKKALREKIRIEQQALANKRLDFVATDYLPQKIKKKDFLP
jgi:DNA topoisomerase VI subunit A